MVKSLAMACLLQVSGSGHATRRNALRLTQVGSGVQSWRILGASWAHPTDLSAPAASDCRGGERIRKDAAEAFVSSDSARWSERQSDTAGAPVRRDGRPGSVAVPGSLLPAACSRLTDAEERVTLVAEQRLPASR